jgi:VIT1/CCC1 family predicted Fe2+/Mn2+ transporter
MIYLLIVISLLISLREGLQQRDRVSPSKLMSKLWHGVGFVLRMLLIVFVYFLTHDILLTLIITFILSILYSISCAIGSKQKWYYLSNSGIDKILRKLLFFIKY